MMKYFYLLSTLLILVILVVSLQNRTFVEGFNNNQTFVLLGDSILQNEAYGKSVESFLSDKQKNVLCYAQDNATIGEIASQVNKLPVKELNNSNTLVFLSAGGNNLLSHYVYQNQDLTNKSILNNIFENYTKLVANIQNKLPNAKLVLLDIYYPYDSHFKKLHSIINEWNQMIYSFANNPDNNIYDVLKISDTVSEKQDFTLGIEPSSQGGEKIASLILSL